MTFLFLILAVVAVVMLLIFGVNKNTNIESLIDMGLPDTNHNVSIGLTTLDAPKCQNFCGPNSICSLTQDQCTSDIDCYGCQPKITHAPIYPNPDDPKALEDAGKLTFNQTPRYSQLTRNAMRYPSTGPQGPQGPQGPPQGYQGKDLWTRSANFGYSLFQKKKYTLDDPAPPLALQTSTTGLFHTQEL
jgi:hypothetical protein